jgi:hypothetical protein
MRRHATPRQSGRNRDYAYPFDIQNFGFPIIGTGASKPNYKFFMHAVFCLIENRNRKSEI